MSHDRHPTPVSKGGKVRIESLPPLMPYHDHQWVTDRIALGSVVSTREHVEALMRDRITHVLDCRIIPPDKAIYEGTKIKYRQLGVIDDGQPKPNEWFWDGIDFALGALQWSHTRVLVHCLMGMSRAPSMVYAILRAMDVSPNTAEARITKARVIVRGVRYRRDAERAIRARKR